jgi:hypothetical protein
MMDKGGTFEAWNQPVETPEPRNAVSRRRMTAARPKSALSALAWMGDPNRTAGNDGVPLQ